MKYDRSQHVMIDLHGFSEQRSKEIVLYWMSHARRYHLNKIRFVTGRGNHVNSRGERGTLYKNFYGWIEDSSHKEIIDSCEKHDGYFEVHLKPNCYRTVLEDFTEEFSRAMFVANLEKIKARADEGDPEFQVAYAGFLEQREPVDFKSVFRYYRLAAEQDYAEGVYHVGRCYLHGVGVRQSDENAFEYLKKADDLGCILAAVALGDCYCEGYGVACDLKIGVALYAKAARANSSDALRKIGSAYFEGAGVQKDFKKAFEYYKKSADLGDSLAQYNVAVYYSKGIGTKEDQELSLHYFKLSAEGGDVDAQYLFGKLLWNKGDPDSQKAAIAWLKKSAENGCSAASTLLVSMSPEEERDKFRKQAAQAGNFIFRVHELTEGKNLTEEEFDAIYDKAIRDSFDLDSRDIKLLDEVSKFLLLDAMLTEGNRKYQAKALSVLEDMAEQSCVLSLRRLSHIFLSDSKKLNIKKNESRAIAYMRQGVALKDSKAMVLLANCYELGVGVSQSIDEAMVLYYQAAELKNPQACYRISILEGEKPHSKEETVFYYLMLAFQLEEDADNIDDLESGALDVYKPLPEEARKVYMSVKEEVARKVGTNSARDMMSVLFVSPAQSSSHQEDGLEDQSEPLFAGSSGPLFFAPSQRSLQMSVAEQAEPTEKVSWFSSCAMS